MRPSVFLRLHRNKILAITFAALACALFLSVYLYLEIATGWTYFRSDFRNLWNFILTAVVYSLILVANIRNDNIAYHGILMFVFIAAFSFVWGIIYGSIDLADTFLSGEAAYVLIAVGLLMFRIGAIALGFVLYAFIWRYGAMRLTSFKPVRMLAIAFAIVLTISCVFQALVLSMFGIETLFLSIGLPIAEALMAVAIIFTLERLRRLA